MKDEELIKDIKIFSQKLYDEMHDWLVGKEQKTPEKASGEPPLPTPPPEDDGLLPF